MRLHVLVFLVLLLLNSCTNQDQHNLNIARGNALGTTYSVQFVHPKELDITPALDSIFEVINNSMSTYQKTSQISKINANTAKEIDLHFKTVFDRSKSIYKETSGVFDPTIGVLVNAWDFGPEGALQSLDSVKISELKEHVGFFKVKRKGLTILKEDSQTYLDFNAIAKGYTVDVVSEYLDNIGIAHYLVEIGGELKAKGKNLHKNKDWRIGIEDPNFDGTQSVHRVISLNNTAMATSGTYRKFKTDAAGNRYSHIINPETGFPSKTNVLSVSVMAKSCMDADAYATAFKAMGIEKTKAFLTNHTDIKVYFIFENENQEIASLALNDFLDK